MGKNNSNMEYLQKRRLVLLLWPYDAAYTIGVFEHLAQTLSLAMTA